jgi:hypothetical protein
MLETLREVLEDIKAHNSNFSTQWHNYEKLMLRGIWFDDKNGAAVLYIDYLYDQDTSPTMTVEVIKEYFHDMEGWYWGSPDLVDRGLSRSLLLIVASFVLIRAAVAQRGMEPVPVVEHLNVVEEVRPRLVVGAIRLMDTLTQVSQIRVEL